MPMAALMSDGLTPAAAISTTTWSSPSRTSVRCSIIGLMASAVAALATRRTARAVTSPAPALALRRDLSLIVFRSEGAAAVDDDERAGAVCEMGGTGCNRARHVVRSRDPPGWNGRRDLGERVRVPAWHEVG